MDAFTDIGWFLYISLDSYKVWMHLQTLVGLLYISLDSYKAMDAFTDIGWFLYISLDSYKVWMHLQTLVGFCTYLLILVKCGCIYRHWIHTL